MVQRYPTLDTAFAALADPTRRGILEVLGKGPVSISGLAAAFEMTLTGVKKHVQVLEAAKLVVTEKTGRVREVRLGSRDLLGETLWIEAHRARVEERLDHLDHLEQFLVRTKT